MFTFTLMQFKHLYSTKYLPYASTFQRAHTSTQETVYKMKETVISFILYATQGNNTDAHFLCLC